jgi:hypothetical protein
VEVIKNNNVQLMPGFIIIIIILLGIGASLIASLMIVFWNWFQVRPLRRAQEEQYDIERPLPLQRARRPAPLPTMHMID